MKSIHAQDLRELENLFLRSHGEQILLDWIWQPRAQLVLLAQKLEPQDQARYFNEYKEFSIPGVTADTLIDELEIPLDENGGVLTLDPATEIDDTLALLNGDFRTVLTAWKLEELQALTKGLWAPSIDHEDVQTVDRWLSSEKKIYEHWKPKDAWRKWFVVEALVGTIKSSSLILFTPSQSL